MKKYLIRNIIHNSLVDGPGNRTAVFLQGCNIKCDYCHNPETQKIYTDYSNSPEATKWMTSEEVFEEVKKDIPFIRGITISGGECTLYPKFLEELSILSREAGLSVLIDSNGTVDLSRFPKLIELCSGVILDIKAWNQEKYKNLTGGSNEVVKRNLRFLSDMDKLEEIRIVCIPGEVDVEEALKGIKDTIRDKINNVNLKLIKFRSHGVEGRLKDTESPSDNYMNRLKDIAVEIGFKVTIT